MEWARVGESGAPRAEHFARISDPASLCFASCASPGHIDIPGNGPPHYNYVGDVNVAAGHIAIPRCQCGRLRDLNVAGKPVSVGERGIKLGFF